MKIDINKKYRYRSGESARVICIDACESYPVIAIDEAGDPTTHTADGRYHENGEDDSDLIEVREPREWWAVVYDEKGIGGRLYPVQQIGEDEKPICHQIRVREIID
jgi:hypothetical protein